MENTINFTTVDRIKQDTAISAAVSADLISPFIESAEIFWLKPTLGIALWTELKNAISGDTLSGNNYTLIENYIIPCANWFAYYEASPFIMYRAEAKGFTKKYSDNSQAVDKKEFELIRQSILDKAQSWKNRLVDFLKDNQDIYTNWRDDCTASSTKHFSGGIFLG